LRLRPASRYDDGAALFVSNPTDRRTNFGGDGSNSSDRFAMRPADPLDNPIWSALTGPQASMAFGAGLARRFAPDVSPLAGLAAPTAQAFADLAALAIPGARFAFFSPDLLDPPQNGASRTQSARSDALSQADASALARALRDAPVGDSDASEMLALAA